MKKRLAIIGFGGQGAWHAGWAKKSDCIELAGIYDIKKERCDFAISEGIKVYKSQDELLSDESVDIVLCATPNDSHKDISIAALRAGKHVVCEKPVTLSVADFDEIVKTAKELKRHFSVHQNRRWDVDYLAIKGIIDSGEIGEVINIESRSHGSRGCPGDWRLHKPSGGMMLDWGVHLIDQIMLLIPEKLVNVYCEMTNITTTEVDDGFNLRLTFESGKRATVEVGTYNFINLPRMYMQCKEGTAYIEEWRSNTRVAKLKKWVEKDVTPVQTAAGITRTMAPRDDVSVDFYEIPRLTADVHNFYRNFVSVIDSSDEPIVKCEEVRRVLLVMEAAFKSWELRQALKVEI